MDISEYLNDIITNDSKPMNIGLVINPADFQMCRSNPNRIFRFQVFLTVDDVAVDGSEQAVHMATPAEGVFVLFEIRGMKIPWKDINGCLIKTYDSKGNVEVHTKLKFYGFKMRPRRCCVIENDNLSRAIVAWHTRPGEVEAPEIETKPKTEEPHRKVEETDDQTDITLLPPASTYVSSVDEIMARLTGVPEEQQDPVLPPS